MMVVSHYNTETFGAPTVAPIETEKPEVDPTCTDLVHTPLQFDMTDSQHFRLQTDLLITAWWPLSSEHIQNSNELSTVKKWRLTGFMLIISTRQH